MNGNDCCQLFKECNFHIIALVCITFESVKVLKMGRNNLYHHLIKYFFTKSEDTQVFLPLETAFYLEEIVVWTVFIVHLFCVLGDSFSIVFILSAFAKLSFNLCKAYLVLK